MVLKEKRISWDDYFIEVMEAISERATCDRGRSGCVIAKNNQIMSAGYVGSAAGDEHCDEAGHLYQKRLNPDGSISNHCVRTVHAEQNAICQAAKNGTSIEGATLYSRMTPCPVCAKMIINCGIKRVVCQKRYHDGHEAEKLFSRCGVALLHLNDEEEDYKHKGNKKSDNGLQNNSVNSSETKLKVKKIHPSAVLPTYAHEGDAGLDLFSVEGASIAPGERVKIKTGMAFEIPDGSVGLIWDRGSVPIKKGLKTIGGVIDSSYRGEIIVGMANISNEPVEIMAGEKIAQILIQPATNVELELSDNLEESERGEGAYGSTDKMTDLAQEIEELKESPLYKKLGSFEKNDLPENREAKEGAKEEDENSGRW